MIRIVFLLLWALMQLPCCFTVTAQSTAERLRYHVFFLSDDSLAGRQTGSKEELIAAQYIATEFKKNNLLPKGHDGYLQPFPFTPGKQVGPNNYLLINDRAYALYEDYYPLAYSANNAIRAQARYVGFGIQSKKTHRDDYKATGFQKGEIAIINMGLPASRRKKHMVFYHREFQTIASRLSIAEKNGASGVIFVKNAPEDTDADDWLDPKTTTITIPVVYLRLPAWEKLKSEKNLTVSVQVDLITPQKTAYNVVGYINNNASSTVVIGAHYDHLGFNEYRNSLYKGAPAIHNGADDNASGVAVMLELARLLNNSPLKGNNYLFVAFSGEELGLLGSGYFVNQLPPDIGKINYMLNYDMVGRLNESKLLTINGIGTSPRFAVLKNIHIDSLVLQTTESGIGPSDHTSFYLKDIPVLHFFTGLHADYHKPTDDANKINVSGMESIVKFSLTLIDSLNENAPLPFAKSHVHPPMASSSSTKLRVTLGIMPSYAYEGRGVKIEGIIEGKPAHRAGLQEGDIIIGLGKHVINNMQDYMQALSLYSKGDKTQVRVLRKEKVTELKIYF